MLKTLLPYRGILILIFISLLLKLFSAQPALVEKWYTYGIYPPLSRIMRWLTGWLPFSLGDLLYAAAGIGVLLFVWRSIKAARKERGKTFWLSMGYKIITTLLIVYILFNTLWALNYSRLGIAHQLGLQVQPYGLPEVVQLTKTLQTRLNHFAALTDTTARKERNRNTKLFQKSIQVYKEAEVRFSFLRYTTPSIKPSLYSRIGHYFGFTGYYNPFSSEAQIKTSIPVFLKPFVVTHEMAHQLGYAKENEANFVAFLTARHARDAETLYSVYYHLYNYSQREVYRRDSMLAKTIQKHIHPQVVRDNEELKAYFQSTENSIEPLMTRFYDQYLKWNNQKSGLQTYNQVIALLIAYGKKFGWQAI
jgi:hypothetical protein